MAEIFQFPPRDDVSRFRSQKPRRSKPRAPAAIIELPPNKIDRRKLRGNPLRDKYALISPAVTIIGKIYTAKLRRDDWWDTAATENWLQTLEAGAAVARHVADDLEKQAQSIKLTAKYEALPLEEKQIVSAEVDRLLRRRSRKLQRPSTTNVAPAPISPEA